MKDNKIPFDDLEEKESRNLFPPSVHEVYEPKSAIIVTDLFKKSMFQLSKKIKRNKFRITLKEGKYLDIEGYVNVTDQDNFLIIQKFARNNTKKVFIGTKEYDYCVCIPKKDLFKIKGYPLGKGGGYHKVEMDSHKRLRSLNITHNIFDGIEDTIGFFSRVGYDSNKKMYYFVISKEYYDLLHLPKALKAVELKIYFGLELDFSRILYLPLKTHFDNKKSEQSNNFIMKTILIKGGKYDWLEKSDDYNYIKTSFKNILFPAFKELEENNLFKFELIKGLKNSVDSLWKVTRLYSITGDTKELADENGDLEDISDDLTN